MTLTHPRDVDLTSQSSPYNPLQATFGMLEYELALATIIRWLADDSTKTDVGMGYVPGTGWAKKFRIDTFPEIRPSLFASLCASGWISNCYFPKGTFLLSATCIERLQQRADKVDK